MKYIGGFILITGLSQINPTAAGVVFILSLALMIGSRMLARL